MEIKHQKEENKGRFYLEVEGEEKAEMTYFFKDKHVIDINHTEVDDSLKGEDVGYKLVDAAVLFMRENNLKAIASCPYVEYVFKKKKNEYNDVISSNL